MADTVWNDGLPATTIKTFSVAMQMRIWAVRVGAEPVLLFWLHFCSWDPLSVVPSYLPFSLSPHP